VVECGYILEAKITVQDANGKAAIVIPDGPKSVNRKKRNFETLSVN
jgi:hypothetical protein